jgi:hypothetical protein
MEKTEHVSPVFDLSKHQLEDSFVSRYYRQNTCSKRSRRLEHSNHLVENFLTSWSRPSTRVLMLESACESIGSQSDM